MTGDEGQPARRGQTGVHTMEGDAPSSLVVTAAPTGVAFHDYRRTFDVVVGPSSFGPGGQVRSFAGHFLVLDQGAPSAVIHSHETLDPSTVACRLSARPAARGGGDEQPRRHQDAQSGSVRRNDPGCDLKEKAEYDTGTDALIALKTAGVSEKIIQGMIKTQSRDSEPAAASSGAGTSAFWQEFPSIAPAKVEPVAGKDYFTRYTFREEKNEYKTTNYGRGNIVPINTPVKLVSMAGSKMTLRRLDNGQEIKVENEDKFTKKSIPEIASILLAAEKTPLEKLPEEVAAAVRNGDMRKGMTRELVLMTRGYPPAHETPSRPSRTRWRSARATRTATSGRGRSASSRCSR